MLKLFARAHDAVQSHASVIADLRTSPEDDELLFVELEIQDCASQIEREAEAILARWEGLPTGEPSELACSLLPDLTASCLVRSHSAGTSSELSDSAARISVAAT